MHVFFFTTLTNDAVSIEALGEEYCDHPDVYYCCVAKVVSVSWSDKFNTNSIISKML